MNMARRILSWVKQHWFFSVLLVVLTYAGACQAIDYLTPAKEIALIIGEPWKDMQTRSTARIGDDIPDEIWFREPIDLAYLRFADPQYGFITPPAKFFAIGFNRGRIDSIRMSPQVEPLPLQDALNIVLSLQEQWRRGGWVVVDPKNNPAHENTEHWKSQITACRADTTFWNSGAEKRYQITVGIICFKDNRYPNEQRFLINLAIARPWFEAH
ncbi:MAG: hypothetical protein ACK4FF_07875 [Limnobacter sp.]|uniref:hypothetical protein n=1 Tax=Limnobacter sp. TaxID=2003368 RepID=UPI00391C4264